MKSRNYLLRFALLAISLFAFVNLRAQQSAEVDGLKYELNDADNSAAVIGFVSPSPEFITIPPKIETDGSSFSITSISSNAFKQNTLLKWVVIPADIKSIGKGAFEECSAISDIYCYSNPSTLNWNVESTTKPSFKEGKATLCHVPAAYLSEYNNRFKALNLTFTDKLSMTINGVEYTIGNDNKAHVTNYTEATDEESACIVVITNKITINDTEYPVYGINDNVFKDSHVKTVTVSEGVVAVGANAFANCRNLINVTLPSTISSIGANAFLNCSELTDIYCKASADNLNWANGGGQEFMADKETVCRVPSGLLNGYKSKFGNFNLTFTDIMPMATNVAVDNLIYTLYSNNTAVVTGHKDLSSVTSLTIPAKIKNNGVDYTVTGIGNVVFSSCTTLQNIELPEGLKTIGRFAFEACTSLGKITIPSSVTVIKKCAFNSCSSLAEIECKADPNNLTWSAQGGEYDYMADKETTCRVSSSHLESYKQKFKDLNLTFTDKEKESSVTLNGIEYTITTDYDVIVSGFTTDLSGKVEIPSTIQYNGSDCPVHFIGKKAFYNCTALTSITIPASVIEIERWAFYGCSNLSKLYCNANPANLTWNSENIDNCFMFNKETKCFVSEDMLKGYTDKFGNYNLEILSLKPAKIAINDEDAPKTSYSLNEELNLGGAIKVTYNDESVVSVELSADGVEVTGFDSSTPGDKKLTVEYAGLSTTYNITVVNKTIVSIGWKTMPTKKEYIVGQDLDLNGGIITVTYDDNSTTDVDPKDATVSGYNKNTVGDQTVTVTYSNKSISLFVIVKDKQVSSIEINKAPNRTTYKINEQLDLKGGSIKVHYDNGNTTTVYLPNNLVTVSDFDNATAGEKVITLTYNEKACTFTVKVNRTAKSIEVTPPTKVLYAVGSDLDLNGGTIKVDYDDKTSETVSLTAAAIKHFDNTKAGKQNVTVRYANCESFFEVELYRVVQSIDITNQPEKLEYIVGQNIVFDGGLITVTYNDQTTASLYFNSPGVTVSGYDKNSIATQTVTLSYQDQFMNEPVTATFNVTVIDRTATSIVIDKKPKVEYIVDDELDLANGSITVIYNNGSSESVLLTSEDVQVSGFENTSATKQTLTVKYKGLETTFMVTVKPKPPVPASIKMSDMPEKTEYLEGENLKLDGGTIIVVYNDGETTQTVNLSKTEVTGFDTNTPGEQTLTVTYLTFTTTFAIMVKAKPVVPVSIELTKKPTKTEYIVGDPLDIDGGTFTVHFSDGTTNTLPIENASVTGFNRAVTGEQTLTVRYFEFATSFVVTVNEKPEPPSPASVAIAALPAKTSYIVGEDLILDGGSITVTYSDESTKIVTLNDATVSGFNKAFVSVQTLIVSYFGLTTSFDVTVADRTPRAIEIDELPAKTDYLVGEELSINDGTIIVYYNNNTTETLRLSKAKITGFDSSTPGTKVLTIEYMNLGTTLDVDVVDNTITPVESIKPESHTKVWSYGGTIYIEAAPGTRYRIIDQNGRVITASTIESNHEEIHPYKSGVMIVNINDCSFKVMVE